MSHFEKLFQKKSSIAFDLEHRKRIRFNISKYDIAVSKGLSRYSNLKLAKDRAAFIKRQTLTNLHDLLLDFELNCVKRGIRVEWASNAQEATHIIKDLLIAHNCKLLVKSKSMTTEEIDFNEHAQEIGVNSIETDLGEFIVQIAGEKPYHIVTPAMHKSKEDIAALFNRLYSTPPKSTPEELTAWVRDFLRDNFIRSDVGVTGANFLIADSGAVSMTENEGNGLLSGSFPKLHIVIAGIEKIIPSINNLDLFLPLLAAHGTGQQLTVYNSLYFGPKKSSEVDGPEKMVVILLDNGRTNLYQKEFHYESLSCIRCGACLNSCPIYKNIGGYTYNSTYSGPIGSVITPHLKSFNDYKHLSFASSLCGKCEEVCPVRIPLPDLLLENRRLANDEYSLGHLQRFIFKTSRFVLERRYLMNLLPVKLKNSGKNIVNKRVVGDKRQLPSIEMLSFNEQWKNRNNK